MARSSITQHCTSGLIPSNSFHLLSCAQITIVNHERVVDAPGCHVLFSFFLSLSCSSAMRIGSPCSSYAVYTQAAVKDPRQFVFLDLRPDWAAWVEGSGRTPSPWCNNSHLFLGHPRKLPHDQLSRLPHRPNFRQNGYSQSGNGSPLIGFALDISTSATPLWHIIDAQLWNDLPQLGFNRAYSCRKTLSSAGENADQCFRSLLTCGSATIRSQDVHTVFPVATIWL